MIHFSQEDAELPLPALIYLSPAFPIGAKGRHRTTSPPPIAEATENEDQFKQSSTGGVGQMDELDFSIWKLSNPTAGKIINLQPEMWQKET